MNDYRTGKYASMVAALLWVGVTATTVAAETTVGTAFTYQGQLKNAGVPFTGDAEFQFTLWDASIEGRQIGEPIRVRATVKNGLFQAELDFGPTPFERAQALWLEVAVETNLGSARLEPRQPITPAPFALYALHGPTTGGSGLTLPYTGSATSNEVAFGVIQSGLAASGAFSIDNAANTQPALVLTTAGSGPGLMSTTASGPAIWGRTGVGGGNAGYFETLGVDNTQPALAAENKASGPAAYFRTTKAENTSPALVAESRSDGSAAAFTTQGDPNNVNLAPTVSSTNESFGSAGDFVVANSQSTAPALASETNGPGEAVYGRTTGSGRAGLFEVDNIGERTKPALEASTNARGGGAGLFRTTNALNTTAALTGESSGGNAAVFGHSQGLGDAVYAYNALGGNAVHGLVEGERGKAGTFQITEPANRGPAVEGKTAGTGAGGYFEATNTSGSPKALHAMTRASNGWAGYFEGRGYFSGAVGIGTAEPGALLELASPGRETTYIKAGNEMIVTTAGTTVGGWVEADRYKFSAPKTSYYALGPADFDLNHDGSYNAIGGSVPGIRGGESEEAPFLAPVHLPHGAFVTNFRVFWYASGTQHIEFQLVQINLGTGHRTVMGYLDASGASSGYNDKNTSEILSGTIDNRTFAYYVRVDSLRLGGTFDPDGWCQGNEIMGASIAYTVTEAD